MTDPSEHSGGTHTRMSVTEGTRIEGAARQALGATIILSIAHGTTQKEISKALLPTHPKSNMTNRGPPKATVPVQHPQIYWLPIFPVTQLLDDRLSATFSSRCVVGTAAAFTGGLGLGVAHGSKTAALRFRAENSHRFPTTSTGWYQYHKSKNYVCMFEGIKTGFTLGARLSAWAACFFYLEELVDDTRNRRDFFSTVVASLTVSGIFSIKSESSGEVGITPGIQY